MNGQSGVERRTLVYSGHVQGVGFRWTVLQIAGGFKVYGYVRNLDDGCVELVAEGAIEELDQFLGAVADGMGSYIRDVQASASPGTNEFGSFTIQH